MPELTREEKLKLVEKLPQQLQDFLYSEDTGAVLLYLGQKYNLPDEKVRLLSKLVADVVLKIVPITSLAQEINSKITSDAQAAMNLAQELNTELLAPVMVSAPSAPMSTLPILPPTPSEQQNRGSSISQPRQGGGEIGTRPAPVPVVPKPTPPLTFTRPIEPVKLAPQPPLIEAEPHKILTPTLPILPPKPIDTYREPTETQGPPLVSTPIPISTPPASEPRPQYIMRPSGAPPTDLPDNVLDLRKDKGEF